MFLCLCSLTFRKTVELQGFRDCSCWEEFSQMKEQLDEMNIPSRPGCCFWYSYRHTTGRRLNKHYSLVKNMTLRSSSSAAVTKATTSQSTAVCVCSETFPFHPSPSPPLLHVFFFSKICMYACTLSQFVYKIIHLECFSKHFQVVSRSQSDSGRMFYVTTDMKLPVQIGHWSAESLQSSPKTAV